MAILETIRENIETAGQITADIAKRTAEMIRLRDQIRRDKKEIRRLTYEIGQTYLRLHADDYEEVYKEFVDGIAAAKVDMEEKRNQLVALKEKPETEEEPVAEDILEADDDKWEDLFEESAAEVKETVEEVKETVEEAVEDIVEEVNEAEAAPEAETSPEA
ncbi:MAG: hypothetical protein IJI25_03850 [Eubacterium sp.]|nr:hypothetical protein [Eubacterium sp.]